MDILEIEKKETMSREEAARPGPTSSPTCSPAEQRRRVRARRHPVQRPRRLTRCGVKVELEVETDERELEIEIKW